MNSYLKLVKKNNCFHRQHSFADASWPSQFFANDENSYFSKRSKWFHLIHCVLRHCFLYSFARHPIFTLFWTGLHSLFLVAGHCFYFLRPPQGVKDILIFCIAFVLLLHTEPSLLPHVCLASKHPRAVDQTKRFYQYMTAVTYTLF